MNCWVRLQLDPTGDTKAVKRAYARLLKQTRPDEKPDEFQQLFQAYQQALQAAAHIAWEEQQNSDAAETPAETPQTTEAVYAFGPGETSTPSGKLGPSDAPAPGDTTAPPLDTPGGTEQSYELDLPEISETSATSFSADDKSHSIPEPIHTAESTPATALEPEPAPEPVSEPVSEPVLEKDPRQLELERLVREIHALLNTTSNLHIPASWSFLLDSPMILDDQFNWHLGLGTLQAIQQHNQVNSKRPMMTIGRGVLGYLDGIFNWSLNRRYIYRVLDPNEYQTLFDLIDEANARNQEQDPLSGVRGKVKLKKAEPASPPRTLYYGRAFHRFLATLIDCSLIYGVIRALDFVFAFFTDRSMGLALILGLTLGVGYFWLAESSRFQSTLGKKCFGLVVTNRHFERMGWRLGLWRTLVFFASWGLGYLTLIVNAFMGDKLVHDRASRTFVIDMRRSRREQI